MKCEFADCWACGESRRRAGDCRRCGQSEHTDWDDDDATSEAGLSDEGAR